jgi:hypothetical protein
VEVVYTDGKVGGSKTVYSNKSDSHSQVPFLITKTISEDNLRELRADMEKIREYATDHGVKVDVQYKKGIREKVDAYLGDKCYSSDLKKFEKQFNNYRSKGNLAEIKVTPLKGYTTDNHAEHRLGIEFIDKSGVANHITLDPGDPIYHPRAGESPDLSRSQSMEQKIKEIAQHKGIKLSYGETIERNLNTSLLGSGQDNKWDTFYESSNSYQPAKKHKPAESYSNTGRAYA